MWYFAFLGESSIYRRGEWGGRFVEFLKIKNFLNCFTKVGVERILREIDLRLFSKRAGKSGLINMTRRANLKAETRKLELVFDDTKCNTSSIILSEISGYSFRRRRFWKARIRTKRWFSPVVHFHKVVKNLLSPVFFNMTLSKSSSEKIHQWKEF